MSCICGEINARNCPVHQDTKKTKLGQGLIKGIKEAIEAEKKAPRKMGASMNIPEVLKRLDEIDREFGNMRHPIREQNVIRGLDLLWLLSTLREALAANAAQAEALKAGPLFGECDE